MAASTITLANYVAYCPAPLDSWTIPSLSPARHYHSAHHGTTYCHSGITTLGTTAPDSGAAFTGHTGNLNRSLLFVARKLDEAASFATSYFFPSQKGATQSECVSEGEEGVIWRRAPGWAERSVHTALSFVGKTCDAVSAWYQGTCNSPRTNSFAFFSKGKSAEAIEKEYVDLVDKFLKSYPPPEPV
jgi:hypothetical protein